MIFLELEWDEYYAPEKVNNEIYILEDKNTIDLSSNGHHYIHDVSFIEMKARSIKYESQSGPQTLLLIEKSIFNSNTDITDSSGGNILFQSTGQCVQNKVCAFNCSSNSWGKHCKIDVSQNFESKNYIEECSFSTLLDTNGYGAFYNYYGHHKINKINITKCENHYYSSFDISSPNKNADILLSNFRNSTASSSNCLMFDLGGAFTFQMSQCNIIEQRHGFTHGVIYVNGYLTIDSCVIKDNYAKDSFLFCLSSGKGVLATNSYLTINPDASNFNDPSRVKISGSTTNDEEIRLDLYSTANCKAQKHLYRKVFEYENFDSFANNFCETFINDKLCSLFGYLVSTSTLTFFPEIY